MPLTVVPQGSRVDRAFPRPLLPIRRPRALVVEDDEDLRPLFERTLHELDPELRVDWAASVTEAVEMLRRHEHELVVADYLLDDGTGLLVKRWIELRAPQTPFGMVSAYRVHAGGEPGEGRGFAFLPKPFGRGELRAFLGELRRGRRPPH